MENVGINGKCWHLIRNWYTDSTSFVRVEDQVFERFPGSRGVKQGSILSSTLFIVVMDSFVRHLRNTGQGLSLSGLNVSSSAPADDIRAASNSIAGIQAQVSCVNAFGKANALRLKTEAISFSKGRFVPIHKEVAE